MSSSYLSVVLSSLDVVITVIQLVVSAWRLHHERTRRSEATADTRSNRKLWLQMGMCLVLAILSILLLVFSGFQPDEKALEVLLSLVGASLIVYQGGYLLKFCDTYAKSLWLPLWGSLFLYYISTVILSALIAKRIASKIIGHTKNLEKTLLSLPIVAYFLIGSVYFSIFWRGGYVADRSCGKRLVRGLLIWKISLCSIALVGALFSLGVYLGGKIDFITSLWIEDSAATVWDFWVLVMQCSSLRKALVPTTGLNTPLSNRSQRTACLSDGSWQNQEGSTLRTIDPLRPLVQLSNSSPCDVPSLKGSLNRENWDEELGVQSQDDPWRQDSTTALVAPSAAHMRDSVKKG